MSSTTQKWEKGTVPNIMAFDGFVTNAVVAELSEYLLGGKVNKIYEPNKNEILLSIFSNHTKFALCLNISSSFYGAYLTTSAKPNPLNATNFCMTLRKHLIGYTIKNIFCNGLERIITIELQGYNELNDFITKKLIIELMGKHSNIILVNEKNLIIDALKHFDIFSGSLRNILPGYEYILPNSNKLDITKLSIEEILNRLTFDSTDLCSYILSNFAGISKQLLNYSMEKLSLQNSLSLENIHSLLNYFLELYEACKNKNVVVVPFAGDYTLAIGENKNSLSVNFFLDDFYTQKEIQNEFCNYRNSILNVILNKLKKIQKKIIGIDEKLEECTNLEKYQLYGELITSNLYRLTSNHTTFVELENYYENNEKIKIPLDISISPAENAKKYFKKYHKLKSTQDVVSKQKEEIEKEISYLESIVYELQIAKNIKDVDAIYEEIEDSLVFSNNQQKNNSKKQNKEFEFLKFVIDGFTVLVGKNNKQNDFLTTKLANAEDLWFHTQDIHGSHVILKTNEHMMPSQETINKVASIAAYYSKASDSSNVPVDYTFIKYVKKPSKSKPGMVIYTHQQTVNVNPQS